MSKKEEEVWPGPYMSAIAEALVAIKSPKPEPKHTSAYSPHLPPIFADAFVLTIDSVDPAVPTQGREMHVAFTLTNSTGKTTSGIVSGEYGGQAPINNLTGSFASVSGIIAFPAPPAGKAVEILLEYFEQNAPLVGDIYRSSAQDSVNVDVITGYILEIATDHVVNPAFDIRALGAAAAVCHNRTATDGANLNATDPTNEWMPILTPDDERGGNVVISGTVCSSDPKRPNDFNADLPFTHPFYNDWTFYLAADPPFESLLSPGDIFVTDTNDSKHDPSQQAINANDYATKNHIPVPLIDGSPAFIEFEMEQGLLTKEYFPVEGDRVAALGRWIVDCGHENYSTEIHPPLILAKATASGDGTMMKVIGGAFLTSQWFNGKTILQKLFGDLAQKENLAHLSLLLPGSTELISPVEAKPQILSPPFTGIQVIVMTVRAPTERISPLDKLLVSYHFTTRAGVGVQVLAGNNPDEVLVIVLLNDAGYNPVNPPSPREINIALSDLPNALTNSAGFKAVEGITGILNPAFGIVLGKGMNTTRYNMAPPASPRDGENVIVDKIVKPGTPIESAVVEDDDQPYPVYGWLNLRWSRSHTGSLRPHDLSDQERNLVSQSPTQARRPSGASSRRGNLHRELT